MLRSVPFCRRKVNEAAGVVIGFDHELAVTAGFAFAPELGKGADRVVGRGEGQIQEEG
jgi:hypothetical protein